jgi:FixJ family two-component response regulator
MSEESYKPLLLILDDEEMVTTSLKNLFKLRSDYRVVCHNSPPDALADASNYSVDLVIADYLMPEMDGITFLSKFTVGLYQYLEKPWDNEALLMVVRNGMEKRSLLRTLERKIAELDEAHADLKSVKNEIIRALM